MWFCSLDPIFLPPYQHFFEALILQIPVCGSELIPGDSVGFRADIQLCNESHDIYNITFHLIKMPSSVMIIYYYFGHQNTEAINKKHF